jgi:hypothetical protein
VDCDKVRVWVRLNDRVESTVLVLVTVAPQLFE